MILGQIPRCLSCQVGLLRFDYIKGEYRCPRYMEDDTLINCNKLYSLQEVKRDKWIEKQ